MFHLRSLLYDRQALSSTASAPEPLPVAVCQFESGPDVAVNLRTVERLAGEAAQASARLAVFPEASVLPIHSDAPGLERVASYFAEHREIVAGIARRAGIAIVAGLFEPSEIPGKVHNSVVVCGADGQALGTYRKIHLYDAFGVRESDRFAAGAIAPLTFSLGGLRFGVLTCYDLRFGELARHLVDRGAEVLVVPAAWARGPLKEAHWSVLLRARAIENTVYVLGAGQCGASCTGLSAIIDPLGVALAGLGEAPGVATATVGLERLADVRRRLPVLENRRLRAMV